MYIFFKNYDVIVYEIVGLSEEFASD